MERKSIVSSNLSSIGYDLPSSILEVEFKNGSIYQYLGVPENVYKKLMTAPSIGSYLNKHIKVTYRYNQLK
jgi:KTSC domain